MAQFQNPFLRGMLGSQQQAQQQQLGQLQAMGMLSSLQQQQMAQQDAQETRPLQRALLEAKVNQAKQDARLLEEYFAARGGGGGGGGGQGPARMAFNEGGMSTPGGGQANMMTGQAIPAGAIPGGQQPVGGLPPHVEMGLLHPRLAPLAKVQAEMYKPTDKMREAVALGMQPGSPEFNAFVGTQFNQGGAWQVAPGGGVQLAGGYATGRGQVEGAEQRERARYDLITRPSTGPNQPPTYASRLDLLQPQGAPIPPQPGMVAPGSMQIPSDVQAGRDATAARIRTAELQPGGGGMIPSATVLPNAAGMSPQAVSAQEAQKEADKATLKGRAESGVKFEDNILESGTKARSALTQLQILAPNLEKLPTGPIYPTLVNAGAYLKQFGIDVGQLSKDLGPAQATDAILKQLALKLRNPAGGEGMPGALSDKDREFLIAAIPGLNKAPDGNKQLLDIMMKLEQRKVDEAAIVSRMQKDGRPTNEIREAISQFAASRELFNRRR